MCLVTITLRVSLQQLVCVCACAGLNDIDVEGEWLVQRQVLWPIPSKLTAKGGESTQRGSWDLAIPEEEREEVTL